MEEPLVDYGLDQHAKQFFKTIDPGTEGRVIRIERDWDQVITPQGTRACERRLGNFGDVEEPAVGDWVSVIDDPSQDPVASVIVKISERRNGIVRKRSSAGPPRPQVLASNVDYCAIVIGLDNGVNVNRLARALVSVLDTDAVPLVALTKTDLVPETEITKALLEVNSVMPDVQTFAVNSKDSATLTELAHLIDTRETTTALLGISGAGKSTLINSLGAKDIAETQAVRQSDARGRHTPTYKTLSPLPIGGCVIDTPGIRSLGIWQADTGMMRLFRDIYELETQCKFSKCEHNTTSGCAVQPAIDRGELDQQRVELWAQLGIENAESLGET